MISRRDLAYQLNSKPGCTAVSHKKRREGYVHRQIGEVGMASVKLQWFQTSQTSEMGTELLLLL